MPDLTTNSEMMRSQQDRDTRQHISQDEANVAPEARDTDAASGKSREAANAGVAEFKETQREAVFQENRPEKEQLGKGSGQSTADLAENSVKSESGQAGLAQPGRSRLGG